ncbi:ribosomal protein S18-alanine N-acetyltransferase [Chloroflexota bacterium]
MACYVRKMHEEDVEQVTEIDREAFPTMWPPANYKREMKNRLAHYMVVCDEERPLKQPKLKPRPQNGFSRLFTGLKRSLLPGYNSADRQSLTDRHYIIGFVGFWVMADEAHITSIAVRENYQRQGIGELMMVSVIDMAASLKARVVTLEVRISNDGAQRLYTRYGFSKVGLRKGYYNDNREDAVVMSTTSIKSISYRTELAELKKALSNKIGVPLQRVRR